MNPLPFAILAILTLSLGWIQAGADVDRLESLRPVLPVSTPHHTHLGFTHPEDVKSEPVSPIPSQSPTVSPVWVPASGNASLGPIQGPSGYCTARPFGSPVRVVSADLDFKDASRLDLSTFGDYVNLSTGTVDGAWYESQQRTDTVWLVLTSRQILGSDGSTRAGWACGGFAVVNEFPYGECRWRWAWHELGHTYGLQHPADLSNSTAGVMSYGSGPEVCHRPHPTT